MRLGQVGLKDHASGQHEELTLVEHLAEGRHREVEVAMLLHVEVDELGYPLPVGTPVLMTQSLTVEHAEPILDSLHGVTKGHEVDLAEDRRDLDRDVLHLLAREEGEIGLQPSRRLPLTQDCLAEQIEIEANAGGSALHEIA